ncbi:hypothetical protein PG985_001584 [Apiospora marii]|uniref:uncharacterized protein n=1 Tax=Apiospora marii TaxID=335849 RepID=UPI003130EB34
MAVIDELQGLEAWVEINGQRAQEYSKQDDDDGDNDIQLLASATKTADLVALNVQAIPHVVKYIEAIPDQYFAIHFKKAADFTRQCDHLGITFTVDKNTTSLCHEHSQPKRHGNSEWHKYSAHVSSGNDKIGFSRHLYKFGEVNHVEAYDLTKESLDKAMGNAKRYGSIAVIVYRMSSSKFVKRKNYSKAPPANLPQEVPEKVFKGAAVTHCTTFEHQSRTGRPRWVDYYEENIFQDPLKRPCAVFEFRYRSKEGLYQEGVLERPDPVDDMSPEELRRLARIGLDHESNNVAKQDPDQKIKQEGAGDVLNRKRFASGTADSPRKRYKETVRDDGKVEVDLE